jgi:gamma-glutamyltranspeptidase/glutathione hydrolase
VNRWQFTTRSFRTPLTPALSQTERGPATSSVEPTGGRLVWSAFLLAALVLVSRPASAEEQTVEVTHGVVVSVSPPASDIGLEILKQGGSAVDAAVATAFALAVAWPSAGNIGGGGFMMIYPGNDRKPVCVEYRETSPAAATPRMLEPYDRKDGHKVCGTPGTVAGLALAHQHCGKLPWRNLVMPAVRLARDGFAVDAALAASLNRVLKQSRSFIELQRVFAPPAAGELWRQGDRLTQPELARTLQLIADHGADPFYRGPIAEQIVAEMRAGGGLIARDDLAAYRAHLRQPIHGTYRGYDVFAPPPPSSGGICLVEMLNILESFPLGEAQGDSYRLCEAPGGPLRGRRYLSPLPDQATPWAPQTMHLVIEAMRRAYCDRARYLGDADFVGIPPHLVSKEYARKLAGEIDLKRPTASESLAPEITLAPEAQETTHFSVVDQHGMAVSNTYTLENAFGCRVMVRGAGFLLNNEMTDFNRIPGHTDRQGLIGTPANVIAPGKRMLSSQTPTLVCRDGRLVLVIGSPGGRTIINTVLCIIINFVDFRMDVRRAVDAPRLHHQWFPDRVGFEGLKQPEYAATIEQLQHMGHVLDPKVSKQGDAHSIWIDPTTGRYVGAADQRIDGKAAGY